MTCSAMLLMCSMYWCSLRWYLSAASWASFCRVDTWANSDCSLLFHLSLAIRASCSNFALLLSSASVTARSASTQQWSPSLDRRSPHPFWQTPSPPRWSVSGFVCDSIPPGFKTWQIGFFSPQGVGQSAHIVCACNFSFSTFPPHYDFYTTEVILQVWTHERVSALKVWPVCAAHAEAEGLRHYARHEIKCWSVEWNENFTLLTHSCPVCSGSVCSSRCFQKTTQCVLNYLFNSCAHSGFVLSGGLS